MDFPIWEAPNTSKKKTLEQIQILLLDCADEDEVTQATTNDYRA